MILVGEARANTHAPGAASLPAVMKHVAVRSRGSICIILNPIGLKDAASRMSILCEQASASYWEGAIIIMVVKQRKEWQQYGIDCGDPQISTPQKTAVRAPFGVLELGCSLSRLRWK